MFMETMDIVTFLAEVMADVAATDSRFTVLKRSEIRTYPIPFFGRIDTARVLTVGVNPSPGEFQDNRLWPAEADATYISERLVRYFEGDVPPHPWFKPWSVALRSLGLAYESGEVAHIDVSPRATIPMSQVEEVDLFLEMARSDAKWLFRLLSTLERPRLVLLAGCVTKKRYMVRFLQESRQITGSAFWGKRRTLAAVELVIMPSRKAVGSLRASSAACCRVATPRKDVCWPTESKSMPTGLQR